MLSIKEQSWQYCVAIHRFSKLFYILYNIERRSNYFNWKCIRLTQISFPLTKGLMVGSIEPHMTSIICFSAFLCILEKIPSTSLYINNTDYVYLVIDSIKHRVPQIDCLYNWYQIDHPFSNFSVSVLSTYIILVDCLSQICYSDKLSQTMLRRN